MQGVGTPDDVKHALEEAGGRLTVDELMCVCACACACARVQLHAKL